MAIESYDVIIVGAGITGISAASVLADYGMKPLVVDDNNRPGGQYLRAKTVGAAVSQPRERVKVWGRDQIVKLRQKAVPILTNTQVIGLTPQRESLQEMLLDEACGRLIRTRARLVLLATGARERFLPFKGWTLPGVTSTGAVQVMLKEASFLPATSIIIAGSGVFPYAVAAEIIAHGGRVPVIWDHNRFSDQLEFAKGLRFDLAKALQGAFSMLRLAAAGTRIRYGIRIIEARSRNGQLSAVVGVHLDSRGRPIRGSRTVYPCECLAIGHGFSANIEAAMLAGCRLQHAPLQGGWVVSVSSDLETTVPGIFAAGEITGIAGAAKGAVEGRIAAHAILQRLGTISSSEYRLQTASLSKRRRRLTQWGNHFNRLNRFQPQYLDGMADESVICRCEEITLGQIREALAAGCRSADEVKKWLRTGMGICQGRTCGPLLGEIIAALRRVSPDQINPLSVRTPLKALTLEQLARPIEVLPR